MNKIATFFRESYVARFLIPLGIILIVTGALLLVIDNKNKNFIETEATVSKVELVSEESFDSEGNTEPAQYNIFVKYTVNEKEYESELGITFERKVGEKIKIVYNPEDPKQISSPPSPILNIILLCGGVVALIGGIISAIKSVKKHNALKGQEEAWNNGK